MTKDDLVTMLTKKIANKNAAITDDNVLDKVEEQMKKISVDEFYGILAKYDPELANTLFNVYSDSTKNPHILIDILQYKKELPKKEAVKQSITEDYYGCGGSGSSCGPNWDPGDFNYGEGGCYKGTYKPSC